jgi:hypothetical protein
VIITREKFIEATGREPEHDDLERVNCGHRGEIGHMCCGWNWLHGKPQFEIGPVFEDANRRRQPPLKDCQSVTG